MANTEKLLLRMEPEQKGRWEKAATQDGRALAGWIRKACDRLAEIELKGKEEV